MTSTPQYDKAIIEKEVTMTTSRSGGAGGQNVNKVESKVTLKWELLTTKAMDQATITKVHGRLLSQLTQDGVLIITAQEHRTQIANKNTVFTKLWDIIDAALIDPKVRKKTRPSKKATDDRLAAKSHRSSVKAFRNKQSISDNDL